MTTPASAPNYSCFLPPSFTGLTDVEDFLTHFEASSTLSNGVALTRDPRRHLFSARLTRDTLTLYRSLTSAQKRSYDELKRLFRQQHKPNADVFKAQVKSFRQLSGQDVSAFYRTLRDFEGKAYTNDSVCNEFVLTTIVEGLAKSVVRWEVRRAKLTVVEDAVSLALEMHFIWTSTTNSPTLPARRLTNWPVLRCPRVNSFAISFSPSRKKLNES